MHQSIILYVNQEVSGTISELVERGQKEGFIVHCECCSCCVICITISF